VLLVVSFMVGCPFEIELSNWGGLVLLVMSFMGSCPFEIETVSWSRFIDLHILMLDRKSMSYLRVSARGGKNFREFGGEYFLAYDSISLI
jgi:hypothetical protein